MNYNEQIKKLREENMLSQREFCQKIDNFVEPWALSHIETQRKKVSPELIERIESKKLLNLNLEAKKRETK